MKDYLKRYIWILSELYQNKNGLTYKEIADRWDRSSQNVLRTPLPKRTFADCLRAIEETFDISISSDARNGYRYSIVQRDWLEKDNVKHWLLSAFAVNGLLQDSRGLRERVMYENIPSGKEHLLSILDAMKNNQVINLVYQDFYDEQPRQIVLEPYFVRVFRERWYVIGPKRNANQGQIQRYALDRISHLEVTKDTFKVPSDLSAASYFAGSYGIIVDPEDYDVECIRLKVTDINHRRQYLRSLPLHFSQKEIDIQPDYSIFELHVMPTYDFIQQILSMNSEVEVLSPKWVREEVASLVKEMAKVYDEI